MCVITRNVYLTNPGRVEVGPATRSVTFPNPTARAQEVKHAAPYDAIIYDIGDHHHHQLGWFGVQLNMMS
jgi:hypothetical protein